MVFFWCRIDLIGSRDKICFHFPLGLSLNICSGWSSIPETLWILRLTFRKFLQEQKSTAIQWSKITKVFSQETLTRRILTVAFIPSIQSPLISRWLSRKWKCNWHELYSHMWSYSIQFRDESEFLELFNKKKLVYYFMIIIYHVTRA